MIGLQSVRLRERTSIPDKARNIFSPKYPHIEDLMLSPKAMHSSSKSRQVGRQAKVFRKCFIFHNVNSYILFVKRAHFLYGSRLILGPRRLDFGITLKHATFGRNPVDK
jgi:hypothetical protein